MESIKINRRELLQGAAAAGVVAVVPNLSQVMGQESEKDEWTAERAQKYWKPMTRAVQHVGVPGYEWQAGVLWDGALVFGPLDVREARQNAAMVKEIVSLGNNMLHVSVGYGEPARFLDRAAVGNPALSRRIEEGYLPLPHILAEVGNFIWTESVFAHLYERPIGDDLEPRKDDLLIVHARFRVRNTSTAKKEAHLWFHMGDTSQVRFGYKAGEGDELGQSIAHRYEAPYGFMGEDVRYVLPAPAKGTIVWHDEIAPPEGMKTTPKNLLEWSVPLEAGEESGLDLTIPYKAISREMAQKLIGLDKDALYRETRTFWKGVVDGPAMIHTPSAFLNEYLKATAGQMAEQIAYRHDPGVWMLKTSPNHYEMYWPPNGGRPLPSLDMRGLTRYSRRALQGFLDMQSADYGRLTRKNMGFGTGVGGEGFANVPGFLGNFGDWTANTLLLSQGIGLWALSSHYRVTRDRAWLEGGERSPLHAILSGCDWITAQRRRTMREENGHKVPHWGLLPAASAHDWFSGNAIFNDAFCIFGEIQSVRLLREINHPRAEEIASEVNDYRASLRDRYREARDRARPVPVGGGKTIPYVPRDVYELDWAKIDWTYSGYSALRAGAWGAFDPHDELVDQALAFMEAGLPRGEGFYLQNRKNAFGQPTADANFQDVSDPAADRHYLWRYYVEYETMWPIGPDLFLQRDDLPRFFEWFFHNFSIVLHKDFRVGVESLDGVPSCAPGHGERWFAIRSMFVNEIGGFDGSQQSLWLLQAIPQSWLTPGQRLGVTQMGTHFGGMVDLEAEVSKSGDALHVTAKLNLTVLPAEIRVRLRSGNGRPLANARVNGRSVKVLEKDMIALPRELTGEYKIDARFA